MKQLRIGLDIDDVLADFMGEYCKYFDTDNHPEQLEDARISKNVQNILRHDRNFWINLPVINFPNFVPELYCTKRVISKSLTKKYLEEHNLPKAPIFQQVYQKGRKSTLIKGRVDLFIDDSVSNMIELNLSGIPCLLYSKEYNTNWGPYGRIFSLNKDEILDTYYLFMETIFSKFYNLIF